MAHFITFATGRFDISNEERNPINPIAGQGVLKWLRTKLEPVGYKATEPEAEDWGWYIDVEGAAGSYLVGASGEPERPAPDVDWTIQIHKSRSLKDTITGKNKMTTEDPLAMAVEAFVRGEADFREIHVEKDA
jgi:hypothetical protein